MYVLLLAPLNNFFVQSPDVDLDIHVGKYHVPGLQSKFYYVAEISRQSPEFRYCDPDLENFLNEIQMKDGLSNGGRVATNYEAKETGPEREHTLTMEDEICNAFVKTVKERKIPLSESFGVKGALLQSNSPNILLDMAYMSGNGMFEKLGLELFKSYFQQLFTLGVITKADDSMTSDPVANSIWGHQEAMNAKRRLLQDSRPKPACKRALERSADVFLNMSKLVVLSEAKVSPWIALQKYARSNSKAIDDIKRGLQILDIDLKKLELGGWQYWEVASRRAKLKLTAISATYMDRNLEVVSELLVAMIKHIEAIKEQEFSKFVESYTAGKLR